MGFLQETVPPRGVKLPVLPGISRIVADNPGVMTYHGTNTYLVAGDDGLTVIDPGPDSAAHVADILAAAGGAKVARIVLTHTHSDHCGAVPALAAATGAPVYGHGGKLAPDVRLADGAAFAGFTALHTPGHAADHLCYEYRLADGRKILFSGDHVMSWSSSIVNPPEGDMRDYYHALERLLARDDEIYLGGHGPLLAQPRALVVEMLAHRRFRERTILEALGEQSWAVAHLAAKLYNKADAYLKLAAQRNVLAHMLKLKDEGVVVEHAPDTVPHPDTLAVSGPPPGVPDEGGAQAALFRADALRRFGLG
jgi:glyoxylase-like metal-dependent hydrolase (beta-lactamase superfamily II)